MKPIVDPMIFYWLGMLETIQTIFIVTTVVTGLTWVCFYIYKLVAKYNNDHIDDDGKQTAFYKTAARIVAICMIIFFIFLPLSIAIPSKETATQMFVASLITPDNLKGAIGTASDIMTFTRDTADAIIRDVLKPEMTQVPVGR